MKTENGTLKRPIQRVYPLEVAQSEPELIKSMREQASETTNVMRKNDAIVDKSNVHDDEKKNDANIIKTRSGRVVKAPEKYNL